MKQSAYPHGFTTTVQYIDTVPWELTFVLALQQELKPLGITVTPKPVSFNPGSGTFSPTSSSASTCLRWPMRW